jgi:methylthioribose-1-phosphate isomerase
MKIETIKFENDRLSIVDQSVLPNSFEYIDLKTLEEVISAIKQLKVRGAPAIGITAAYGFYLHLRSLKNKNRLNDSEMLSAAKQLKECRPTAVNLAWAVDKMIRVYENNQTQYDPETILALLKDTAIEIHNEDRQSCAQIGSYGSQLINNNFNILTHCNAGILATGGMGTALSPIYSAAGQNKNIHVYVDETRPVGQGARLTFWELSMNDIPATLITDNMAGSLMKHGKVDMVIVGADRIAMNGDTANKIGTYSLAVLANYHNIPFYIAAPVSTFDKNLKTGSDIPIEYRDKKELLSFWNINNSISGNVYNPAFDVTPADLISGIITEKGILKKPLNLSIKTYLF